MAHTVFICHASNDKQVADAACAALEAQRIPCWIAPRDILAGVEYQESIIDALSDSQIVLLIFSAQANDSPQVRREIERAVSKGKIIVPFRIEDVMPSRAMEFALSNTHWLDALTPPLEHHLAELCHAISRLLQRHKEAEPPLRQPQGSVSEDSHVIPLPVTEKATMSTGEEQLPGMAVVPKARGNWVAKVWKLAVAVLLVALLAGGGLYYWSRHQTKPPKPLTDKDTIVLSDFDNKTGDAVFSDTLKQGLSVQLEQSPFLALISDSRVNETLKLMGRSPGDRLTPDVTREVCLRTGSTAMLTGSIAELGSQYGLA
jgi:hypothetical protein